MTPQHYHSPALEIEERQEEVLRQLDELSRRLENTLSDARKLDRHAAPGGFSSPLPQAR